MAWPSANPGNHCYINSKKETATYYTTVWPRPDTRLISPTPPQPVSASEPPPTSHPPSYWLLLFSSQTFSCTNTATVLSSSHTWYQLPMKMEQIVFRNVGIYNSDAGELPKRKHNISSWFQTFAVVWILCVFFWVFPLRLTVVCRRFGTLYQFHLHRLDTKCEVPLHTSYPAYEDGTDRVFRNVGIQKSDAGEIPKRIHTK